MSSGDPFLDKKTKKVVSRKVIIKLRLDGLVKVSEEWGKNVPGFGGEHGKVLLIPLTGPQRERDVSGSQCR